MHATWREIGQECFGNKMPRRGPQRGCRCMERYPGSNESKSDTGMVGRNQNPYPSTHTLDPSHDWRGYRETQTQTQAPQKGTKPCVHSPGTEAARAMQGTQPNEIRSPGVRLHSGAFAALGLEAERATPKHLRTPVRRTCMHAFGNGIRQEVQ